MYPLESSLFCKEVEEFGMARTNKTEQDAKGPILTGLT